MPLRIDQPVSQSSTIDAAYAPSILNYATARARADLELGRLYQLIGRTTANDGAYGAFVSIDSAGISDNDGTLLVTATPGIALRRQYNGAKHIDWFGGKADWDNTSGTDNLPALMKAIAADQKPSFDGRHPDSGTVELSGERYFSDTVELDTAVILRGISAQGAGPEGVTMNFDGGKTGIVVNRSDTTGDTTHDGVVPSSHQTSAEGAVIEGLTLQCKVYGTSSGETPLGGNGIAIRTKCKIRDVKCNQFALDGIHIDASYNGGIADIGDANLTEIVNCTLSNNKRHGLFVSGADSNACVFTGINAKGNNHWGIYDSSFLGNTYNGCHTATNGLGGLGGSASSSRVEHAGNIYWANPGSTDALYIATTPGTDEGVWIYQKPGGSSATVPAWSSSAQLGDYHSGGGYLSVGSVAANVYIGCYSEFDQGGSWLQSPANVFGGLHGAEIYGSAVTYRGTSILGTKFLKDKTTDDVHIQMNLSQEQLMRMYVSETEFTELLKYNPADSTVELGRHLNGSLNNNIKLTTNGTPYTFGRTVSPDSGALVLGNNVFLGNNDAARQVVFGAAPPTTGEHGKGDIVFNSNPSNGNPILWRCTTSGDPGVWEAITGN